MSIDDKIREEAPRLGQVFADAFPKGPIVNMILTAGAISSISAGLLEGADVNNVLGSAPGYILGIGVFSGIGIAGRHAYNVAEHMGADSRCAGRMVFSAAMGGGATAVGLAYLASQAYQTF